LTPALFERLRGLTSATGREMKLQNDNQSRTATQNVGRMV
jgi:hypothetical protein